MSIILAYSLFRAQAQVFPESDAIWNIQIDGVEHYYGLSGDTIISGVIYNKLYSLSDTTLNIGLDDEYLGGFRQEGKKVWFRPSFPPFYPLYDDLYDPPYPDETLVYDFSKSVGDTIWHNAIPGFFYWAMRDSTAASIITSVDTDEQGREIYHSCQFVYHNRELVFLYRCDSWIEGVGSVEHGLFFFLHQIITNGQPVFHLNCLKQGNEVKYINKNYGTSCFCSSSEQGISEKNITPLEILHENNSIRIKGVSSAFPCELKLFSTIGQLIIEKRLQSDQEEMLVNQLKGIYLYQIQKNGEIIKTGKTIIK